MQPNLQPILENQLWAAYPLQQDDFEVLHNAASDPEIWAEHPNPNRWQKDVFGNFFQGALQSGGAFKIIEKSTQKVIGSTRFYDYNPEAHSILIGYTFYAKRYWGSGANQAIKTLMLNYIFEFVDEVYFHVGAHHIRSIKAMTKLGAEKIGEQEVVYFGEASKLNAVFRITKKSWRATH